LFGKIIECFNIDAEKGFNMEFDTIFKYLLINRLQFRMVACTDPHRVVDVACSVLRGVTLVDGLVRS
jgi:hypothetical protein